MKSLLELCRRLLRRSTLMPEDAYPPDPTTGRPMTRADKNSLDRKLHKLMRQGLVPTTPGEYVDGVGDPWRLDADGRWTDRYGVTRDQRYAPIIALFIDMGGPFTRVEDTSAQETS